MSSEGRRLAVGTSWTLFSTFLALIVGAILNPVLVLYLGVDGYGEWAAAIAVASLFGLGGDLGVSGALTKFTAERRGRHEDLGSMAGSALLFALLAGFVAGALLAGLSTVLERGSAYPNFAILLQIQALQMPLNLGIASLLSLYQGRQRFRALAGFSILQVGSSFGLAVVLLLMGRGIEGVMIASLVVSVIVFGTLIAQHRSEVRFRGYPAFRSDFRTLVPFGFRLTLTNAFSTALYHIDLVVLTFLVKDPVQLGLYALATFVTRTLWIIPGSIGVTTYPVVSEYASANQSARVGRYMSTALVATIGIMGVLSTAFILFGRPAITLVFGQNANPAYDLGLIMLLGTAVLGCHRSVASAIPGVGRPDVGLRVSAAGAGILLALCVPLVAAWGSRGAAVAVTVAFAFVGALLSWSIRRYVLRPFGAALDMKRVFRVGSLAIILAVVATLFSLPENPSLESWIVAGAASLVATLVMIEASGGRQTWAAVVRRPPGEVSERI